MSDNVLASFTPARREELYAGWRDAVRRTLTPAG